MVVPLTPDPGRAGPVRGGVMGAAEHGRRPRQGLSLFRAKTWACCPHQRHQPQVLIEGRLAQLIHNAQQMLAFAGDLQIEVLPGGLAQQSHQGGTKHGAAQAADAACRQRLIRRTRHASCRRQRLHGQRCGWHLARLQPQAVVLTGQIHAPTLGTQLRDAGAAGSGIGSADQGDGSTKGNAGFCHAWKRRWQRMRRCQLGACWVCRKNPPGNGRTVLGPCRTAGPRTKDR